MYNMQVIGIMFRIFAKFYIQLGLFERHELCGPFGAFTTKCTELYLQAYFSSYHHHATGEALLNPLTNMIMLHAKQGYC